MALKVGTEDKKKVYIAAGLGVLVLGLAVHTLLGGSDTPTVAPAAAPATARVAPARAAAHAGTAATSLDPTLHPELMAENEAFVYHGTGRNIFSLMGAPAVVQMAKIEKVKAQIRPTTVPVTTVAAAPPPPPAIDLKFYGYETQHDGSRKAFLLHGDDVFIASEGDVVSHRYKVVKIALNSIQVEDLPYHDTQSLPLTAN
jgi:hypothetical protein